MTGSRQSHGRQTRAGPVPGQRDQVEVAATAVGEDSVRPGGIRCYSASAGPSRRLTELMQ